MKVRLKYVDAGANRRKYCPTYYAINTYPMHDLISRIIVEDSHNPLLKRIVEWGKQTKSGVAQSGESA